MENIWGGQSALSAVQELFELVLVRWDRREQWSPWNCILLTKDEAKAHCRLDNVQEVCVIMCVWGGSVYGGGEEEQGNARYYNKETYVEPAPFLRFQLLIMNR